MYMLIHMRSTYHTRSTHMRICVRTCVCYCTHTPHQHMCLTQDVSQETYDGLLVSRMGNLTRETLHLPPLRKKVQGPFRAPEEVLRQRYKPLQPSLRVMTAYDSVETARQELRQEEWRGRVVEERWVGWKEGGARKEWRGDGREGGC